MDELNQMQTPENPVEEAVNTTPATPEVAENQPEPEPESAEAPVAEEPAPEPEKAPTAEMPAQEEPTEPIVDYTGREREQLIEDFKVLLEEDIESIKGRVQALRNAFLASNKDIYTAALDKFLAEGGAKEDFLWQDDNVTENFHKLYKQYTQRRQQRIEELEAKRKENLAAKKQILEELKAVIDCEDNTNKKIREDFNALQERWKAIGDVPREEVNDLWQSYHFLIEQCFNKIRINNELIMLDMKKNLEQKIGLCEKVEDLMVETNVQKAFRGLQELRNQWKAIGPVPREQNEEIWTRFCKAADQIMDRFREHNESRRAEFEQNLLAKQALMTKVQELTAEMPTDVKQWNDVSAQLDELLKVWKTIGPVPRENNEDIWKSFKGKIDEFYTQKKAYFDAQRSEYDENYNKKVDLCLRAEAIAKREDWKKATEELLQLQAEWKAIGPVSRKLSEKIWQRFRGACDEFFAKKGEHFNSVRQSEGENLAQKEQLIADIKAFVGTDDREANIASLKEFQRRWMEIGFVPSGKKDAVNKAYHAALDEQFEKLRISAREAEESAYRERVRNASSNSKNFVNNEKMELLDKLEKLRSDLNTWENNLGFFSTSMQADLLKSEFEKKMQHARQQIALLEAKLRILREAEKQPATE